MTAPEGSGSASALFGEDFLRRLESLRLAVRRRVGTAREGDRSTARPGGSAVFHSHRPYAQGDDLRSIDWPLYARLGQLFLRERTREEALRLHLVVDGTPSMAGPKGEFAARMAVAVGYVAGGEGGTVTLWGDEPRDVPPEGLPRALETLRAGRPAAALRRLLGTPRPFAVVLSDLWDDVRPELAALLGSGGQVSLVRVLGREEIDPPLRGMARIVDVETGAVVDRFVGEEEIAEYRRLLAEDEGEWRSWARRHEVSLLRCAADDDVLQAVLVYLWGEGVLE